MNIAVCGYYGMGNFGDDLFLRTFQQVFYPHQVYPWNSQLDPDKTDAVIIGGGDLITPYAFNTYYFPPALKDKPTWLYGVGIVDAYPEETWPAAQVEQYREVISRAKRAVFRDPRSADIARRAQFHKRVEVAPDMAFSYRQPKYPYKQASDRPTIGICVFAYESFPFESFVTLMKSLSDRGYHLRLIPAVNHPNGGGYSDYPVCVRLKTRLREMDPGASVDILPLLLDLDLTYSAIQSVDYLISFKLHPTLVALRAGVPVLAFSGMSKIKSLLASFGLEQYYCNYKEPLESFNPVIDDFLTNGPDLVSSRARQFRSTERESIKSLLRLRKDMEKYLLWHKK
ncbi:polysaccharide pyruvyl transferase family protein [Paenibacillus sp. YPG26]|uniref:polysaccharide pyruvyl transferase family protein n=1 Tax=Paenibacillus sp. YPG26 TaxID=2878915 RepID=UPI0020409C7C|nr:polysaccharide pyruvyl transferase family protein [Paenibacillus sp. YPG26]USB32279.1 polysaccharide pyruvyl transferase family protein [Paenibacillus sp. YPG26]